MGTISTIASAMKALLEAQMPAGVPVLVGVDPNSVDIHQWPRYVVLVPQEGPLDENLVIGGMVQEEHWRWDVYAACGYAGREEDALTEVDTILDLVSTALSNQKPVAATCGPLQLRTRFDLYLIDSSRIVYRQEWYHFRSEG